MDAGCAGRSRPSLRAWGGPCSSPIPTSRPPRRSSRTSRTCAARAFPGQRPDQRGAGAYDIMLLLARAIDKVGADRKAIRDYLARVGRGQPPFAGVTGPIAFDANGDVAGKTVVIGVVRDGRLVTEVAR